MVDPATKPATAAERAPAVRPARPVVLAAAPPRKLRIALAHDWLCGRRGGEAVLERIAVLALARAPKGFDRPPLYVLFDDGELMSPAIDRLRHVRWGPGQLPGAGRMRRWLLPLYPRAVESLSRTLSADHQREPFDLVISTSSAAIKGLRAPEGVPHLCYCHSPARYVWSQRDRYKGGLRGWGLERYGEKFRAWDKKTAANVTAFIANSGHTAEQIRECYGAGSTVVHPPVRTEFFTPGSARREEFWLWVGALEPYKQVELAIAGAGVAKKRLVVVGDGTLFEDLKARYSTRVTFLGRVQNEKIRDLYRRARLLVFPQVEDFGIVAGEAQACGLPVLARNAGGALEIVTEGKTGAFFEEETAVALAGAAERVPEAGTLETTRACRASAERFSEARFEREISAVIARLMD